MPPRYTMDPQAIVEREASLCRAGMGDYSPLSGEDFAPSREKIIAWLKTASARRTRRPALAALARLDEVRHFVT